MVALKDDHIITVPLDEAVRELEFVQPELGSVARQFFA